MQNENERRKWRKNRVKLFLNLNLYYSCFYALITVYLSAPDISKIRTLKYKIFTGLVNSVFTYLCDYNSKNTLIKTKMII